MRRTTTSWKLLNYQTYSHIPHIPFIGQYDENHFVMEKVKNSANSILLIWGFTLVHVHLKQFSKMYTLEDVDLLHDDAISLQST